VKEATSTGYISSKNLCHAALLVYYYLVKASYKQLLLQLHKN